VVLLQQREQIPPLRDETMDTARAVFVLRYGMARRWKWDGD